MSRIYLPLEEFEKRKVVRQKKFACAKASHETSHNTPHEVAPVLPSSSSLQSHCKVVYDQGQLGSCTANAFCGAHCILQDIKQGSVSFRPSRLYFYYKEREIEHTVKSDSGAEVTDGESYVQKHGICSETSWPYDIKQYKVTPPSSCDHEAKDHKISSYRTIPINDQLLTNIKQSIVNQVPVLIAISVYESFDSNETAQTGLVTIPKSSEKCEGGHEMCLVGYDDSTKLFTVLNSWGTDWGQKGFCHIPYDYLMNPHWGQEFTCFNL
jgi:C1A family cysteine protease